ncbi:MAG: hypothetical protein II185_07620 [Firmicutes bacterium]|nr:hypothetical protein [Bacillota bacterium]
MTSILDQVNAYYIKTQERIDFLGKEMQDAPCGSLRIRTRSGNKAYYVRSYEQGKLSERYIPPTDKNTITALARKRYARYVLPYLKQNLRAAHQFIKMYSGQEEDLLAVKTPADILGASGGIYVTAEELRHKWLSQSWTESPDFEGRPQFRTLRGDYVRSKSEAFIADALYRHDQPYLYEKPLFPAALRFPLFPDFTILNVFSGKELYWEHFGIMDDPVYAEKACRKISYYLKSGIIPGDSLICTFETTHTPLGSAEIETLLKTVIGNKVP